MDVRIRSIREVWTLGSLVLLIPLSASCAGEPQVAEGSSGMVVAVSAPAVEVGVAVLKDGGNAVDAAVAVAMAMAVTYPQASNIGGGGFMMVHPPDGVPVCVEYRETAPAAATESMFRIGETRFGHKIIGTPGTVRGLALAHHRFGRLPWKRLVQPAVRLAEKGFSLDSAVARSLNAVLKDSDSTDFAELHRVFGRQNGEPWKDGDRLVQPDLAKTLARIAEHGADGFYKGPTAELLASEMKAAAGLITLSDLAAYRANVRRPVHGTYRSHDVYGPPPPSSGGTVLIQMLNMLEGFELRKRGRYSPETLHLMIETMKRAYLDRARHLGDADFVTVPRHLTRKPYARRLATTIDPKKATPSESLAPDIKITPEGESTTHFSVIDRDGMGVSNTYTLEFSYGSRVVVRGAGFLLNNEMGDFNWKRGYTSPRGYIGTPANLIAPGKRMLSSQTPTIVARDGKVVLLTGSPGGRTIINTSLAMVLNTLEFNMSPREAMAAPRLHHQWLPDRVRFEASGEEKFSAAVRMLESRGHKFDKPRRQGDAHSIWVDPKTGKYIGVADGRISGRAAGY